MNNSFFLKLVMAGVKELVLSDGLIVEYIKFRAENSDEIGIHYTPNFSGEEYVGIKIKFEK